MIESFSRLCRELYRRRSSTIDSKGNRRRCLVGRSSVLIAFEWSGTNRDGVLLRQDDAPETWVANLKRP